MASEIYIFAGGGTGGHLYPALATAGELLRLRPAARVVFACSERAIDRRILGPTPHAIVVQPVRPMPRRLRGWLGFARAYVASAMQARALVADLRPKAVLGLGGFAAAPAVCRAAKAGVRTGLLNPDAVPGRANRMLARRVDAIFAQFASTGGCFGARVRSKVQTVGCPVRAGFGQAGRAEALRHFGLRADRRTLFVNGGSLGAASINEAIACLSPSLGELGDRWQLLHVTGPAKTVPAAVDARLPTRALEYCRRMDLAYAAADLALSRAGAATVAEIAATGTPAVLMPYPYHADQHQRLNAGALAETGAAVVCEDAKDPAANAETLRGVLLPILRDAACLERMGAAAARHKPANAAQKVARWLVGQVD
jgi:UDP-N-acetylglucosamine--N-acetylmuramyl-(pentapeptide) pyrophosphoryl-undecaprenol N-acetylglucosamine transferase